MQIKHCILVGIAKQKYENQQTSENRQIGHLRNKLSKKLAAKFQVSITTQPFFLHNCQLNLIDLGIPP